MEGLVLSALRDSLSVASENIQEKRVRNDYPNY